MSRAYSTARSVTAGCFQCNGSEMIWHGGNAQGVAARHHDATGHTTWADVNMSVVYGSGPRPTEATEPRRRKG